jgi:hypothetical protein
MHFCLRSGVRRFVRKSWYVAHVIGRPGIFFLNCWLALLLKAYSTIGSVERRASLVIVPIPNAPSGSLVPRVLSALALIESTDPRRFRRILSQISFLTFSRSGPVGGYLRIGRICRLNAVRLEQWRETQRTMAVLAAVLVHEATHGLIESRRFAYTRQSKGRIESICSLEEARFLVRLAKKVPDLGPFPERYRRLVTKRLLKARLSREKGD